MKHGLDSLSSALLLLVFMHFTGSIMLIRVQKRLLSIIGHLEKMLDNYFFRNVTCILISVVTSCSISFLVFTCIGVGCSPLYHNRMICWTNMLETNIIHLYMQLSLIAKMCLWIFILRTHVNYLATSCNKSPSDQGRPFHTRATSICIKLCIFVWVRCS